MRKIREILRLKYEVGLGLRDIARSVRASPSTVHGMDALAEAAKLPWPLPADLSDEHLEELLYPGDPGQATQRPEPDWRQIHDELRRKGVTLQLLWLEYKRKRQTAPTVRYGGRCCTLCLDQFEAGGRDSDQGISRSSAAGSLESDNCGIPSKSQVR